MSVRWNIGGEIHGQPQTKEAREGLCLLLKHKGYTFKEIRKGGRRGR